MQDIPLYIIGIDHGILNDIYIHIYMRIYHGIYHTIFILVPSSPLCCALLVAASTSELLSC
jgi:hypothetical protein